MKHYLLIACLAMTACANLPPGIEDPPAVDISYQQALANMDHFKSAPVRWGGTIIEVENEPDYSAIQILSFPLGSYGRPETDEPYQGRFVVKSPEFIDPAVYTKNMAITVAGTLEGYTERTVGNKALRLPLVNLKQVHLWPERNNTGYYGGYGGYGYYQPFIHHHHRHR